MFAAGACSKVYPNLQLEPTGLLQAVAEETGVCDWIAEWW